MSSKDELTESETDPEAVLGILTLLVVGAKSSI